MSDVGEPPFQWWMRLTIGLCAVFALFQAAGSFFESDRGQAGLMIGTLVVVATIAIERLLFGEPMVSAARRLGLGRPAMRGLVAATMLCMLLLLVIPGYVAVTGASFALRSDWLQSLPGLFGQAGIAEEILFRGYLFRHVREHHTFGNAAVLSMVPFVGIHLFLFRTLTWPLALAAVLLAASMSFPLAYLFELGGRTIWAPAFLHFVVQGAIKMMTVGAESSAVFPLVWVGASAAVPFVVFLVPRQRQK